MNWKQHYDQRCVDAETALRHIKPGSRIVFGHCIGEPMALVDTMTQNKEWFTDVEIVHMVAMGKGEYTLPEMAGHFRHNSFFVGGCTRKAVSEGRADFTPCFFYEIPKVFRSEEFNIDVALIQVSPPDKYGYVNLGVSVDYTTAAIEQADMVIAQVNVNMPVTFGDSFVHVSKIDWFVEHMEPLVELPLPKITDVEKQIGENCASLIEDGATLQLGIVNNSRKAIHKGKSIVSFLMGTKRLYDFVDRNPSIEMHPVDYVNDPTVVMQNSKMVSINSCVQVDLMGQVASESVGLKQISAVGGQVDFVRGANMAKDGKSIIAITSTAAGGKLSKIVPFLAQGAAVTTSRNDVNYVVTEYGVAHLKGKTLRERARQLIGIAHPNFRPMLTEEWETRFKKEYCESQEVV